MRKKIIFLMLALFSLAFLLGAAGTSTVAPAGATAADLASEGSILKFLAKAFHFREWRLAMGCALTLLVMILRKVGIENLIDSKHLPWVTTGIAVLGAIGPGISEGLPITDVLVDGLTVGWMAIGGWETVGKLAHQVKQGGITSIQIPQPQPALAVQTVVPQVATSPIPGILPVVTPAPTPAPEAVTEPPVAAASPATTPPPLPQTKEGD